MTTFDESIYTLIIKSMRNTINHRLVIIITIVFYEYLSFS